MESVPCCTSGQRVSTITAAFASAGVPAACCEDSQAENACAPISSPTDLRSALSLRRRYEKGAPTAAAAQSNRALEASADRTDPGRPRPPGVAPRSLGSIPEVAAVEGRRRSHAAPTGDGKRPITEDPQAA